MTPDDLGLAVSLPASVGRVVSLVPSLTESVAASAPGLLRGATDWCTHPAELDVTRVGGTKNPDVARIVALAPDVVLANEEENRAADLDALREAGVPVWVTQVRTVDEAFSSLDRMLRIACGLARPAWLDDAVAAWGAVTAGRPRTAAVPIWRRPWMVLGRDTFAGDVLARLGIRNAFGGHAERYPRVSLDAMEADLVVLPDEPYAFSPADGPECFPGRDVALVSGRHLTWYGPSLVEAPAVLRTQLAE
ncbi:MAG TPA: helical backbone metal receptor [Mycobacterium sp.]|nr:helical backbone metal receptor [Mycobacterium sp.]